MKSLIEFLRESKEKSQEKTFIFNFKELDNAKETINSLVNNYECCTLVDDNQVEIKISKSNEKCNDGALEIIGQYINSISKSVKLSSNEHYAQLVKKFTNTFNSINDYIDSLNASDDKEKESNNEDE